MGDLVSLFQKAGPFAVFFALALLAIRVLYARTVELSDQRDRSALILQEINASLKDALGLLRDIQQQSRSYINMQNRSHDQ